MPPRKTCVLFLFVGNNIRYVGYDVQLLLAEPLAHKLLLIREANRIMQQLCVGRICFIPTKLMYHCPCITHGNTEIIVLSMF